MNVFLVAFEFPPLASAGIHRALKFSRYLPEFGIRPVVLTTDEPSFRQIVNKPIDLSLLEEIPDTVAVERIPCQTFHQPSTRIRSWSRIFFSLVEPQAKFWKANLEKQLPRLVSIHNPAVVCVSVPPFGMGPLWVEICRRLRLPLVLDFRDAWSQWRISPYASWAHYCLTVRLERRCLDGASRVICSSDQIRSDLLRLHPTVAPEKLVTLTNGYDQRVDDFSIPDHPSEAPDSKYIIGYVGSFYYEPAAREAMMLPWWHKKPHRMIQYAPRREDWLYRSPFFFFRCVSRLISARPELRHRLRIRLAGTVSDWIRKQVSEFGLEDIVEFLGYLDHDKSIKFQSECHALLITSSKVVGGADYSIAGKTFEYFAARRPIVAFVT